MCLNHASRAPQLKNFGKAIDGSNFGYNVMHICLYRLSRWRWGGKTAFGDERVFRQVSLTGNRMVTVAFGMLHFSGGKLHGLSSA